MKLSELRKNQSAVITSMDVPLDYRNRLLELNVGIGSLVRCTSPCLFEMNGARYLMSPKVSVHILVELSHETHNPRSSSCYVGDPKK